MCVGSPSTSHSRNELLLKLAYLAHARRRMDQRLSEADVEITVNHPHEGAPTPKGSNRYMRTMSSGRSLKVWVADSGDR